MKYANHHGYTDVNPYEVIKIVSAKCIEIRAMIAEKDPSVVTQFVVGGFSAFSDNAQKWIIDSDKNCPVFRIRKNVRGDWKDKHGHRYVLADHPIKHYDYNF